MPSSPLPKLRRKRIRSCAAISSSNISHRPNRASGGSYTIALSLVLFFNNYCTSTFKANVPTNSPISPAQQLIPLLQRDQRNFVQQRIQTGLQDDTTVQERQRGVYIYIIYIYVFIFHQHSSGVGIRRVPQGKPVVSSTRRSYRRAWPFPFPGYLRDLVKPIEQYRRRCPLLVILLILQQFLMYHLPF